MRLRLLRQEGGNATQRSPAFHPAVVAAAAVRSLPREVRRRQVFAETEIRDERLVLDQCVSLSSEEADTGVRRGDGRPPAVGGWLAPTLTVNVALECTGKGR